VPDAKALATGLAIAFAAGAMLLWRDMPKAMTLAVFAALSGSVLHAALAHQDVRRSFFGVHKIFETQDGYFRLLVHGTTIHGAMRVRESDGKASEGRPAPTTYYAFDGPLGQAISSVREKNGGKLSHVAAIGLGVGSLACHAKPGEVMTFYEIDPLVIDIARDRSLFRYLSDCAPGAAPAVTRRERPQAGARGRPPCPPSGRPCGSSGQTPRSRDRWPARAAHDRRQSRARDGLRPRQDRR
jgi:hypothetical protein